MMFFPNGFLTVFNVTVLKCFVKNIVKTVMFLTVFVMMTLFQIVFLANTCPAVIAQLVRVKDS